MKSRIAAILLMLLTMASTAVALSGCSKNEDIQRNNAPLSNDSTSLSEYSSVATMIPTANSSLCSTTAYNTFEPETSTIPEGEPTIFVGPDGNVIYSSEITRIEGSEKNVSELTKADYGTAVLCEGFQYFVEPTGVAFNNFQNPEVFDDFEFKGDIIENRNHCKRINVGEEIMGLKLVNAVSEFMIENYDDTPEPYYYDGYFFDGKSGTPIAEFEGSISLEGFFTITERNDYEPDGGGIYFQPTEDKLPILGCSTYFSIRSAWGSSDYITFNETTTISCGNIQDTDCNLNGLTKGDTIFARVTLSDIKYYSSYGIDAGRLEKIEPLSDILAHNEDRV